MSWRVEWLELAEKSWKLLPFEDAERVAKTVVKFASSLEGEVELLTEAPEVTCRLRVGAYTLLLALDENDATVWVVWMTRRPGR